MRCDFDSCYCVEDIFYAAAGDESYSPDSKVWANVDAV